MAKLFWLMETQKEAYYYNSLLGSNGDTTDELFTLCFI